MPSISFENKVVLVTGGGMGLGKAYCLGFGKAGAKVVCPDINLHDAEETVSEVKAKGGEAMAMNVDVTQSHQVENMVREIIAQFGRIDALVNNVGYIVRVNLLDTTEEIWDRVINTNLKSTFLVTRAVVPLMIERKMGKVLNVSSLLGLTGMGCSAYTAAKSGLLGLTKVWALELAPHNIQVNCVAPGFIRTPGSDAVHSSPLGKKISDMVPLGTGDTDRLVPAVLFLCSEGADYMTGQCVAVDGGFTAVHDVGPDFRNMDLGKNNE